MSIASLLVIDDDNALLYSLKKALESSELRVITENSAASGIEGFHREKPTVVLLDLRLHESSGLDILKEIRDSDESIPVIMFTAYSTTYSTIEASKLGAFDYLLKPVDLQRLRQVVERAVYTRQSVGRKLQEKESLDPLPLESSIVGSSAPMLDVYKQIGRIASSNANVLILGESGTGKELAARAVHDHSRRRSHQFVALNCAALSETLLESELFGHERGAFTGADRRRIGKFEYAHSGSIFLDEIGDMTPTTQAKILRVLQEQRFERLGGNESIQCDVRIIAATNRNLEERVKSGHFREDLYYRLNVLCLALPALRQRREDIPELFQHFVQLYKGDFGKDAVLIGAGVIQQLMKYSWPGNLRELQSVTMHALSQSVGAAINLEHLPGFLRSGGSEADAYSDDRLEAIVRGLLSDGEPDIYGKTIAAVDRLVIPMVLDHARGNLQQACSMLGISRNTLKSKMREHGIKVDRIVQSPGL